MSKIKDYINHKDGTFAEFWVDAQTKQNIISYCEQNKLKLFKPDALHLTIVYSRKPCPSLVGYQVTTPVTAKFIGFELLGNENDILVFRIHNDYFDTLDNIFKTQYGVISDYPDFKQHVTIGKVSPNTDLALLPKPEFDFVFDHFRVVPLDPEIKVE